jgi:MFS-type transporter involved in bile tolerance (Atg22 family)
MDGRSAARKALVVAGVFFLVIAPLGLLFTFMAAFFPGPEAHNTAFDLAFLFVFMFLGPVGYARSRSSVPAQ